MTRYVLGNTEVILNGRADLEKMQGDKTRSTVGPQVYYFALSGSDSLGTGTFGNPFATPGRCQLAIPHGAEGVHRIEAIEPGTYQGPPPLYIRPGPAGCTILHVGNRQVVTATWPLTPSATLVAGKYAQYTTVSNGYAGAVTEASHWLEDTGFGAPFDDEVYAYATRASTTPNVVHTNYFNSLDGTVRMYPMNTVYDWTGSNGGTVENLSGEGVTFYLAGLSLTNPNLINVKDANIYGSVSSVGLTLYGNCTCQVTAPSVGAYSGAGYSSVGGVVGFVSAGGSDTSMRNLVVGPGADPVLAQGIYAYGSSTALGIGNVDFERTNVAMTQMVRIEQGFSGVVSVNGNVSVSAVAVADPATLINMVNRAGGSLFVSAGSVFTGTITGTAFTLAGRQLAGGLEASIAGLTRGSDSNFGDLGVAVLTGPYPKLSPNRGTIVIS